MIIFYNEGYDWFSDTGPYNPPEGYRISGNDCRTLIQEKKKQNISLKGREKHVVSEALGEPWTSIFK